ncbi:protein NDRG3 isoform X4 [Octopus sinensis]|uniref:Protein NDRG3 isoform X4 n=1 Tax=Octopus sinensis TaxID=2607531 RepID=A0A6P7S6U3_9MOLL|nr:protein NDRG3 isoform X4 [Octopus sinensis]
MDKQQILWPPSWNNNHLVDNASNSTRVDTQAVAEHNSVVVRLMKGRTMERLTDIELSSVHATKPKSAGLVNDATSIVLQEEDVETPCGNIRVAIQGDRAKPAILTFHDIGLNHTTCFQGFFGFADMQPILRHFCVYHLNAPGQEEGALQLRPDYSYPTMEQLADAVHHVVEHYNLRRIIGFGVGTGANILVRYSLCHPSFVDSLVVINPTCDAPGWIEWGYQKMNMWYLFSGQMTNFTEEYLLWHWFGKKTRWENHDLVNVYKDCIKAINPQNLALFIESYLRRTDLGLIRELDNIRRNTVKNVKCRTMLLVGDDSPHLDEVVNMNGRMDPQETDFVKIADCGGMPLEEQPAKVCEAFRYFLQGMGYSSHFPALIPSRSVSTCSDFSLASTRSPTTEEDAVEC